MIKKIKPPLNSSGERHNRLKIGKGIIRAISISNTRKITARRKKRVEKGIREELLGSKPHSNGLLFSRSLKLR